MSDPVSHDGRKSIALTGWQVDYLKHVMKYTVDQVNRIVEILADAGVVQHPLPTDPRERALYLRKHRNTGPGKPIQEQRRKR